MRGEKVQIVSSWRGDMSPAAPWAPGSTRQPSSARLIPFGRPRPTAAPRLALSDPVDFFDNGRGDAGQRDHTVR